MTREVTIPPKYDDVIYEQPLVHKKRENPLWLKLVVFFDLARLCIDCLCMQRVWLGSRLDLARHKIASLLASSYINVAVTLSKKN